MVNFNHSPKSQLWIIWFHILHGWLRPADQHPYQDWLGSCQRGRPHVVMKYAGRMPFFFFLSFLATRTGQTREPISTHDSSKDAVWRKEVLSKQVFFEILTLGVIFPENPTIFAGNRVISAKMKKSNNISVENRQNISIEQDYKLWVTFIKQ